MSSSVGSQSFIQYYTTYCKERKVRPKVHLLANNTLKINADCLVSDDWNPIIKALRSTSTDLHSIIFSSKYLYQCNRSELSRPRNRLQREPDFLKENLFKSLIEAIGACISNTDILSSVSLEGFPIKENIEILNDSLNKQKCLQHLSIPNCVLREEDVASLSKIITLHTGLRTINLTGCGITINGSKHIAALIRSQKLVRYGETWKQSLRYRNPKPEVVPGIRRITLNDNVNIGDEGFKIICYELIDDLWIKAIDFQNCGITDVSSDLALQIVQANTCLEILDLRMNYISSYITKYISESLQKSSDDSIYEWLSTTNPTRSITTGNKKKTTSNQERTGSALSQKSYLPLPTNKKNYKLNTNDKFQIDQEKYGVKNITIDNTKLSTNGVKGELERTKNILHKVSCRLFEERIKRESVEKQHKQCKNQLDEIRNCLEQHNNKATAKESKSNTKVQTNNHYKRNGLRSTKISKKNSENIKKANRTISKTSTKTDYNKLKHKNISKKQIQANIIQCWTKTLMKNANSI